MVQEPQAEQRQPAAQGGTVWRVLGGLFLCGSLLGPPLDGIHTNVGLLEYDSLPLDLGMLRSLPQNLSSAFMHESITCCMLYVPWFCCRLL